MKKLLLALLALFAVILFAACEPKVNTPSTTPSTTTENDTVPTVLTKADTIVMPEKDTIHCVAITKNGTRCKNHVVPGDTLCNIHKKGLK